MSAWLLRAYPAAWRERYGAELVSLIEAGADGGRVSVRVQLDVIAAGIAQRLRSSGLVGCDGPPERRIRAGVLVVLSAWAAFVVAGLGFAKTAEHWQAMTPRPDRGVAAAAYGGVLLGATLGTLAVLLGIMLAVPALVAFLRTGGWKMIHRPVLRALGATGLTAFVLLGVISLGAPVDGRATQRRRRALRHCVPRALSVRDWLDRAVDAGRGRDRVRAGAEQRIAPVGDGPRGGDDRDDGGDDVVVDALVGVRRRLVAGAHARPDASDDHCDLACDGRHVPLGASPALVSVEVCFETHSTSIDNELGIATGWNEGELSEAGRRQAVQLGDRRRHDRIAVVFTSDLRRAVQTAELAFAGSQLPIVSDRRLRECNYGELNGMPRAQLEAERLLRIDEPFPGGESWRQAVDRVAGFLHELPRSHDGERVLVIGHVATRWALDQVALGVSLDTLAATPFEWREGWEYTL